MNDPESILRELFRENYTHWPVNVSALPLSGSDRRYYRISDGNISVIGAWNENIKENSAFIKFSQHLIDKGLPVPEILNIHTSGTAYLQTDLGDITLFSLLSSNGPDDKVIELYQSVLRWLPLLQVRGAEGLDTKYCYPRQKFDEQSMMWDLNYFKYYFAKLSGLQFDEQALEDDFATLVGFLSKADSKYFMFRDFQSRNIMIKDNSPYFIDYQGGRLGALQYDLASLLYDAKANLPNSLRSELLEFYLNELEKVIPGSKQKEEFLMYYPAFVLMRILQALGAYGYRGYYQKKEHFLQSIPYAIRNLKYLFAQEFPLHLPELVKIADYEIQEKKSHVNTDLKVRVNSFSFKQGIPNDTSGNGGGFVFDCRALPNPGRLEEYQLQSGLDEPVITWLRGYPEIDSFLENTYKIIDPAVKNYIDRGFKNLMISFGCTGGRHRSVYCAEKLSKHLNEKFGLSVVPEHFERNNW
jgi:aminoglycoside/choline kinase family phosphotransferase